MGTFRCRRRDENWTGKDDGEAPDSWRERDGLRHCSYCGSLHPDTFFASLEAGLQITPTDKSYKAYIEVADPLAGRDRIVSVTNAKEKPGDSWEWASSDVLAKHGWGQSEREGAWVQFATRGKTTTTKFYYQHLSPEQMQKFLDLLRADKMNIAVPGYFYTMPFFIQYKNEGE